MLIVLSGSLALGCKPKPATHHSPRPSAVAKRIKAWDAVATKKRYFDSVISPWAKGVENPLPAALERIPDRANKTVIDLGTGVGNALPLLARLFGKVTAIDFSPKMVARAKKDHARYSNIDYAVVDMRDLSAYRGAFDVSIAVNSVLMPSHRDVMRILREIYEVTKPGGYFFGVMPSVEGLVYGAQLTFERELSKSADEARAWRRTRALLGARGLDLLAGTYAVSSLKQKYYYRFELVRRLQRAGFVDVQVGRVLYPWRLWNDPQTEGFEKHPPFWDWYVSCRKPGPSFDDTVRTRAPGVRRYGTGGRRAGRPLP